MVSPYLSYADLPWLLSYFGSMVSGHMARLIEDNDGKLEKAIDWR
jgi:hypothetical protein